MLIMASQFPWNSSLILPTSLFLPPFTIAMLTSRGPHVAPKDSHSFLPSRGCPSCPKGSGTTAAFYPSSPHSYMDNVFVKHREGPSPQSPATPSQNIPQEKRVQNRWALNSETWLPEENQRPQIGQWWPQTHVNDTSIKIKKKKKDFQPNSLC